MSEQLFTRDGHPQAANATIKGKPAWSFTPRCGRCGGAGGSDRWAHTGYTCFDCGGSGMGKATKCVPLYTREKLDRLNATKAKADAKRAAVAAEKEAARKAEADAKRDDFRTANLVTVTWLEANSGSHNFLGEMVNALTRFGALSDGQLAAVEKFRVSTIAREAKRAASDYVGAVGDKIETDVTVERVTHFERPCFNAYWVNETVHVVTMRDAAGNAIVSISPAFDAVAGATFKLRATVKAHSTYKDERQTRVNRCRAL